MTQVVLITVRDRNNKVIASDKIGIVNYQVVRQETFTKESQEFTFHRDSDGTVHCNSGIPTGFANTDIGRMHEYAIQLAA